MTLEELIGARTGHFVFESGHHGTLWLDLDQLFLRPAALLPFARELAARLAPYRPAVVCGPLTGGALLASMVAQELDAAFVYSSPGEPSSAGLYPRAYSLPPSLGSFVRGRRTAIIDDVINAGSAVTATLTTLAALKAEVVVASSLMILGETGRRRLAERGIPVEALEQRSHDLHEPSVCPLCAAGVRLTVGEDEDHGRG